MRDRAKAVAERLRVMILERGWNQSELARRSGMRPSNVSNYLRGTNVPNPRQLAKLAEALGTTPGDILNVAADTAAAGPHALCLTPSAEGDGNLRLQIDQVVPAELATQVIGLLLPRINGIETPAPEEAPEAPDAGEYAARADVRTRNILDVLLPATPPRIVNAKQIRPLDGPAPLDETVPMRKAG